MKLRNLIHYLVLGWLCTASITTIADTITDKKISPEKADAETHEHHDHEQHEAHQHGIAKLMLATGGNGLEIMLETPASNVIGFEHLATSDEEQKAVKNARQQLEAGEQLFAINPEAGCSLLQADVTSALFEDKPEEKKDITDQEKEKEKKKEKEKIPQQPPQTTTTEPEHRDVDASWSFSCAKPENLKSVSILLFKTFPGFQQINAEWITESGGSALSMDNDTTIVLTQ